MITLIERYGFGLRDTVTQYPWSEVGGKTVFDLIPREVRESDVTLQVLRNGMDLTDEGLGTPVVDEDVLSFRTIHHIPALLGLFGLGGAAAGGAAAGGAVAGTTAVAAAAAAPAIPGWVAFFGNAIIMTGIGIGLNYAIAALTGSPEAVVAEEQPSQFGIPQNTTANGTAVSIVYGQRLVAGHILQAKTQSRSDGTNEILLLIGLGSGGEDEWESIAGLTVDSDDVYTKAPTALPDADVLPDHTLLRINGNYANSYRDVRVGVRMGGFHQAIVPEFDDLLLETTPLEITIKQATGEFQFFGKHAVDSMKLVFRWASGLFNVTDEGEFFPYPITIRIKYRPITELDYTVIDRIVSRSTRTDFVHEEVITGLKRTKYEVLISRITADDPVDAIAASEFQIAYVDEIASDSICYVNKALLSVKALATDQLHGSQPTINAVCKGLRVRVYTTTTAYTYEWTQNAAWIILDYLTNKRYGLGRYVAISEVNIQDFITFAARCAEQMLIEGGTSTIPRAYFNLLIDAPEAGWEKLYSICQSAQASLYRIGGQYRIRADAEDTPIMAFTPGNTYNVRVGYTSPQQRANYVTAFYDDERYDYQREPVVDFDQDIQNTEDFVPEEIQLPGVTNRYRALALVQQRLRANKYLTRYATWEADITAIRCEPGDVVEFGYHNTLWGTASGRVRSATSGSVTLDREVTLEDKNYTVKIWQKDGTSQRIGIANKNGVFRTLTISGAWTTIPDKTCLYLLGEQNLAQMQLRIASIRRNSDLTAELFGVQYDARVYQDGDIVSPEFDGPAGFNPRIILADPTNLRAVERIVTRVDGSLANLVDVFYVPPVSPIYEGTEIWVKLSSHTGWGSAPVAIEKSGHARIEWDFVMGERYDIAAVPRTIFGAKKTPGDVPYTSITIRGDTSRPDDVSGFIVTRNGDMLVFTWNALIDPRIAGYEIRNGINWESAVPVVQNYPSVVYETSLFFADPEAIVTQTFLIKARNRAGVYSLNAASVSISIDPKVDANLILSQDERADDWPGTLTNMQVDSGGTPGDRYIELIVASGLTGSYETGEIDLGSIYRTFVNVLAEPEQIDTTMTWAAADFTWESTEAQNRTWQGTLGENNLQAVIEAKYGTTSPITADYAAFVPEERTLRYAKFKVTLTLTDAKFEARLSRLRLLFDVPDILDSEEGHELTGAATDGSKNISYNKTYTSATSISLQVMARNLANGERLYVDPAYRSATGFRVQVLDSSGNEVTSSRTIDWFARGY